MSTRINCPREFSILKSRSEKFCHSQNQIGLNWRNVSNQDMLLNKTCFHSYIRKFCIIMSRLETCSIQVVYLYAQRRSSLKVTIVSWWNTPAMFLVLCPYPTPYPKLELDSLRVLARKERDRSPRVFCRQLFIQRFRWLVALFVAVSLMSRKNTRASCRLGLAPPCMDFLFIL